MDILESFELGRICERLTQSRGVILRRVDFRAIADGLATRGAYDLTTDTRKVISGTGLESVAGSQISFAYAGVLFEGHISEKALSEILLAEDTQRQVLVQAGIPCKDDSIRVVDVRERDALKGLLKKSAHPEGDYSDAAVERRTRGLNGIEAYLDSLIGRSVIAAE